MTMSLNQLLYPLPKRESKEGGKFSFSFYKNINSHMNKQRSVERGASGKALVSFRAQPLQWY